MATLDSVVREFLIESGDSNLNRYPRYYQFAVSYLRENNMDQSGLPKIATLHIEENDTADLPADYLQYRFIGLVGADGLMHSMGRNDKLAFSVGCHKPGEIYPRQNLGAGFGFASIEGMTQSWRNGEFIGKMFGVNGGVNINGEYRIDLATGKVQFGALSCRNKCAVMEYISDINSINSDFEVHPFIIQALKDNIAWRSIKTDRNRSLGEIELAHRVFINSERWALRRLQQFTIEEFSEVVRSGNTASVKF